MKIRCQLKKFEPLFSLIASFASAKDARPILQNVKLVVNESKALLMATDEEVGARCELPSDDALVIERAGEAILPAKLLCKILAETTDEEITLELEGTRLNVKGNHMRYQLDTIDEVDKFPAVEPFEESTYFKLPVESLNRMIRRTVFATATDNSHYQLKGVKFVFGDDRAKAIATDGRRLAYQECALESVSDAAEGVGEEKQAIFAPRTLNLLERASSNVEEALVTIRDTKALIKIGNFVVTTTLMSGRFPDWTTIIPDKSMKKRVDFITQELARAVRQAEIVASENKPGVWFKFGKGKVNITAVGEETGESNVELPVAYDDEPTELRLDPNFLNRFFREAPQEDTVAFYFQHDYRTLFETTDGYRYVVMQLSQPS